MKNNDDYEVTGEVPPNLKELSQISPKKYFYQTDPADGQLYVYENNWSDKLGECIITITKKEADLTLEEQEAYKQIGRF